MGAIILILIVVIITVNLIINLSNLAIIITHCNRSNSVQPFWSLYYEHCVSGRAIYSTIISFIVSLFLFIALSIFIFIRRDILKKQANPHILEDIAGRSPIYNDIIVNEKEIFYTNLEEIGLSEVNVEVSGKLRVDCIMAMMEIEDKNKLAKLPIKMDILQNYGVMNGSLNVPLTIAINNVQYPVYFIYSNEQLQQFKDFSTELIDMGIPKVLYFSRLKI